jgi:hypothetical protein
MCAFL